MQYLNILAWPAQWTQNHFKHLNTTSICDQEKSHKAADINNMNILQRQMTQKTQLPTHSLLEVNGNREFRVLVEFYNRHCFFAFFKSKSGRYQSPRVICCGIFSCLLG